jgi:N-formylglutamate amidohydrolase
MEPIEIPTRKTGCIDPDFKTIQLSLVVYHQICSHSKRKPHLIINHLHRTKIDQNRKREAGEQGFVDTFDSPATLCYDSFHNYIQQAKEIVLKQFGSGHLFDLHGQSHTEQWTEVGFGLPIDLFYLSNFDFDFQQNKGTCLSLCEKYSFSEIVRGNFAMGTLFQNKGWRSVPSQQIPNPGTSRNQYFNGGFIVRNYGSTKSGRLDATQIEVASNGRTIQNIEKCGSDLAQSIFEFMNHFYPHLVL